MQLEDDTAEGLHHNNMLPPDHLEETETIQDEDMPADGIVVLIEGPGSTPERVMEDPEAQPRHQLPAIPNLPHCKNKNGSTERRSTMLMPLP